MADSDRVYLGTGETIGDRALGSATPVEELNATGGLHNENISLFTGAAASLSNFNFG
ncbi:MAG: hypothetical protein HC890_01275 [Chloroflexaceae bacterium]|nr:hypothetical protein [Chloroflexaceae bacterium]